MPGRTYNTVAIGLVEYADQCGDHFESMGYRVRVEYEELGCPDTPTFVCDRNPTTTLVEVTNTIELRRIGDWVRYAKSAGKDTRVAVCVPHTVNLDGKLITELNRLGVGLYIANANSIEEHVVPRDQAFNVALPEPGTLPRDVRTKLGSAYEQFQRQQWREGFEDACQTLEVEARKYLNKWTRTGRIRIVDKKGIPKTLTARQINKMTMGQLADTFDRIQAQNRSDSVIGKALRKINKDRVGVVHYKRQARTESRLRVNVGRHMWVIIAALKVM